MTTFSIAMCTYNGAKYLPEQLESLLCLDPAPIELVVGDDGSTDDTVAILNQFSSRSPFPVRITSNSRQLGYGENFIQAASRCSGDWVAFCDQDDVWLPSKLGRCREAIESGPSDLGLIVHNAIIGDANLNPRGRMHWPKPGLYPRLTLPPDWLVYGFRQVVRRSLFDEISPRNRCLSWIGVPDAHDGWICLIAGVTGSVVVLDDPLAIYRRHEANTTEEFGFARRSILKRARDKIRKSAEVYQRNSAVYASIAECLSGLASAQRKPERRDQFLAASGKVAKLSLVFAARAATIEGRNLRERLGSFWTLTREGAYYADHGVFGTREAALDLLRVFLPYQSN
ncbi:MAG TPA: glycosyltransferase [Sphingomicrobium sp.]|nr:glycosyltransferase [Sphingomicrobium sp.]